MPCEAFLLTAAAHGRAWRRDGPTGGSETGSTRSEGRRGLDTVKDIVADPAMACTDMNSSLANAGIILFQVWQRFSGTWATFGFHVRHNGESRRW